MFSFILLMALSYIKRLVVSHVLDSSSFLLFWHLIKSVFAVFQSGLVHEVSCLVCRWHMSTNVSINNYWGCHMMGVYCTVWIHTQVSITLRNMLLISSNEYTNFLNQEILLLSFTWNCLFFDNSVYLIQAIQAMKLLTLSNNCLIILKVSNFIACIAWIK